jgi:hypothetical protein
VHEAFNRKFTALQKDLASIIFDGKDLLYPLVTYKNAHEVREIYLLRAVDQIYKSGLPKIILIAGHGISSFTITSNSTLLRMPLKTTLRSKTKGLLDPKF